MTGVANEDKRPRTFIRLSSKTKARAQYWAEERGYSSVNEYIAEAVADKIARENGDYDLPTLEIARLNQVVDEMKALSTNVGSLEASVLAQLTSLTQLTTGDTYLMDAVDGELGGVQV